MSTRPRQPVVAGQKFGRLTTVEEAGRSADGHKVWKCVCDCGNECMRQTNNLRAKGLRNCGCASRELSVLHGMHRTPAYESWGSAKGRCHNATDKDFHRYGARGIRMCDEWRESFEAFHAHMGDRPAGKSLERKDTNGNYEPGNCTWATPSEQARNRRSSVYLDWRGERRHLSSIAEELGITYGAAFMRLKRGKLHDHSC